MTWQEILTNGVMIFVAVFGSGWLGELIKTKLGKESTLEELTKTVKDIESKCKQYDETIDLVKQGFAAYSYTILAQRLYHYNVKKGYADDQDRKEIEILYKAYKAFGWNGDMDARHERFCNLPYSKGKE